MFEMKRFCPSPQFSEQIRQKISYQFSIPAQKVASLIPAPIEVELSKRTNRLRYIFFENQLWGVIRPHDGFFLLTPNSAKYFIQILPSPQLRVIVQSDVSEYIQKGGNVFAKHVMDCDPSIIPNSEVIIVNEVDSPLAIGRALLTKDEMLTFQKGIAVKVRKGI
jgi:predicted RNA-binding protein (TIGR00451 family)